MKKLRTLSFVLLALVVIGLLLGFAINNVFRIGSMLCTMKGCPCELNLQQSEIPCNSCMSSKFIFFTGLVNIIKNCKATQIAICKQGNNVDYRMSDASCKYNMIFLGIQKQFEFIKIKRAGEEVSVSEQTLR